MIRECILRDSLMDEYSMKIEYLIPELSLFCNFCSVLGSSPQVASKMTASNAPGLVFFDICFDSADKVFYAGENVKGHIKIQLERPKVFAGMF